MNHAEISIPKLASLYLTHDWNGYVKGLKDFPRDERPPVAVTFFAFRLMVAMWLVMLVMTIWAWILGLKGRLYDTPSFLRVATWTLPVGYVAVTAGWFTTEVGRQPWVVYGHLRTADAVTPFLTGADVGISLFCFILVYLVIFGAGFYYLVRLVQRWVPEKADEVHADHRPARPLSAATR
jgi:cytochrome d ubiquinol oxidase subunit I